MLSYNDMLIMLPSADLKIKKKNIYFVPGIYSHFRLFQAIPANSSYSSHLQQSKPSSAKASHSKTFPAIQAISSKFLTIISHSSHFTTFSAISSHFTPFSAISSHFQPFQPFQTLSSHFKRPLFHHSII